MITGTHVYGLSNTTRTCVFPVFIETCHAISGSENITRDWNMTSLANVTIFLKYTSTCGMSVSSTKLRLSRIARSATESSGVYGRVSHVPFHWEMMVV